MNYNIYKLSFKTSVHFGKGRLSSSNYTIYADTLFSALYKEAILIYGENGAKKLYDYCIEGKLRLSDTMPFKDNILYVPKPILALNIEKQGNSNLKKKFKALSYIPLKYIKSYVKGEYEPSDDENNFGEFATRYGVKINENDDNEPFTIGTYKFYDNCGLYFIVAFENDEVINMLDNIILSLAYTGIGGKVSSGLGKFETTYEDVENSMVKMLEGRFDKYMSLSISMPKDNELDNALYNATFELIKRSGFVSSYTYSNSSLEKRDLPLKKNDFYSFKAGSCFEKRFEGDIFDVSAEKCSVYRYAMPMFIGII